MYAGRKKRTKTFGFLSIYQNFVVEVSFPMDPKICMRDLYEICFGTSYVNDRTHICEGWWKKQTSSHGGCKLAHRTWQYSHKTLGKLKERWSVKPTKRCVVAVNQIWYLICDLINIKSGKISMFSGRCRGQDRWVRTWWRMIKAQWQKPAWVLCLFGGNCALTPQTNGARSSFPSTQPHSTVQYVTWWWWSPIKASSFCNLSTPGVPCSSPPWVNYPIFAASSFICVRLIRFSSDS